MAQDLFTALQERYSGQISVNFIDVDNDEEMQNHTEAQELLKRYTQPLIYINGQPRMYGGISEQMITSAIDEILK